MGPLILFGKVASISNLNIKTVKTRKCSFCKVLTPSQDFFLVSAQIAFTTTVSFMLPVSCAALGL